MRLENYISDLLYRHQCVTIPGFGSFITNQRPARIIEETNTFIPPSKEISFNAQIVSNDGLLTRYVSDAEKISYEEALNEIFVTITDWNKLIRSGEKLPLKNIGELSLNSHGNLQFEPSRYVNYLASSFGLGSVVSNEIIREQLKEEVEALEEKAPILFTPEKRKSKPYLKYAAVLVLAASITGTIGYRELKEQQTKNLQITRQQVQDQLEKNIQEATFFNTAPLELPAVELKVIKEPLKYHIIAGAFRVEENADVKIEQLKEKGFNDAEKVGVNKYGLHQVAYASFAEVNDALAFLRKIKSEVSKDAWLLVQEN